MADKQATADAGEASGDEPKGLLVRARSWATGSPLRSALIAGGLIALMAGTVAVWLVMASMAAGPPPATIEVALEKLDEGDLEYAENYVRKMQDEQAILTRDYGGPLFVLGAVRAKTAEMQWAPERRRRDYVVAAKYLEEALALGVPEDRDYEAHFLLGKSFIGSDQLDKGAEVLSEALHESPTHQTEIHALLAQANFFAKQPAYQEALRQIDMVLADPEAPDSIVGPALLRRAQILARLGRHGEALSSFEGLPGTLKPARVRVVEAQVLTTAAAAEADSSSRREKLLDQADQACNEAERLDKLSTSVSASAQYLRGLIRQLRGDAGEAIRQYTGVRRRFGMSDAGVAASMAEGDLLRAAGQADESLIAYRRALDAVEQMTSYQSDLLPISDLKIAALTAHSEFVANGEFDAALTLVGRLGYLLGETFRLELLAQTQQEWGEAWLEKAASKSLPLPELQKQGRLRLREAGVSYEKLADERFATVKYPDDLWRAAEAFYRGQSYTSAARLLRAYVKNEPVRYNAQAMLRLGQSLLALDDTEGAIAAFEECIEFHPNDASVYGARLSAARAYRDQGKNAKAEQLLRANLIGGTLSPRSPEWRDSKFELGSLLHDVGRHVDAIDHLEEAIMRYPDAKQQRTASYLVAESYRQAAEEPKQMFLEAKAVNEKEKNEREFRSLLSSSLKYYDRVQREISRSNASSETDRAMLRNCYMLKGSVYFDLEQFREAVEEYSNVSALYQNEPFVLETLLQISYCWRRLGEPTKARGNIEQALLALGRLPEEIDLREKTTRSRAEWLALLTEVRNW